MKNITLAARMALRYLRAPKSYSAVNAIAIISVVGVAVATAAIVCVLSVFNGFHSVIAERINRMSPDVEISPASGKVMTGADSIATFLETLPEVELAMPVMADNALVLSNGREMPVKLKGVDMSVYGNIAEIDSMFFEDTPPLRTFADDQGAISIGVAQREAIYAPGEGLVIFAPRREGRINMANPIESFITDSLTVAGIFQSLQNEIDENTVVCDITKARDLFQYEDEGTSIELTAAPGVTPERLAEVVKTALGPDYTVKDRFELQQMDFRMVSIEKWVTFLLLIFILGIASFNIISTLCMTVIEKQAHLGTLSALGMSRRNIGATFWWESLFVTLAGGISGIVIGVALCLIQEYFGLIKLVGDPSTMVMRAYPVVVKGADIGWAALPVVVIGLITAWIASSFARSRIVTK